ncbi:MAG: PD-(D/E)XK nuclease family protein [Candidatus Hodarchaeota archaeon]
MVDKKLPKNTWFDREFSPIEMLYEALDIWGENVQGIFTTWLAKQTTCEFMVWHQVEELYTTHQVTQKESKYSIKGNLLHNRLAFGTDESPINEFSDGPSFPQWKNFDNLKEYQGNRLQNVHDNKITEYSLAGEIEGLKIRGTFDAFELETGTLLEYKTRAKPTIPYIHERKNKMQLLIYYFLLKDYNKELNNENFPVDTLSDYAKLKYFYQETEELLGEYVIHVPYEKQRFLKSIRSYKEFWMGERKPRFNLKYCFYCIYKEQCYYHNRYYRTNSRRNGARKK